MLKNNKIRKIFNLIHFPFQVGRKKIFCISMQRNGTTSVGDFLSEHGIRVARWKDSVNNNWTYHWSLGDFETIFNSIAFKSFQAYEDDPWWMPDFYKVLYHRFPKSKFILFYRNSDDWFDSMVRHSDGKTLGNTYRHCKIYRRLSEFYQKLDSQKGFKPTANTVDNLMLIEERSRNHYKMVYEEYNREATEFLSKVSKDQFFLCSLYDSEKWHKLGKFLGINVKNNYNVHSNKSNAHNITSRLN
ncbi:hypothetical protein Dvar_59330 [Desulfosarcina variabilis str. Montpellier]|uniref:sulfotransferase n=1 Tax=Desulfosarcina variabilis TaxID=2300 RepID=UPI003AFA3876